MTKKECEVKIAEKLEEIVGIYLQFNPDGKYLNLVYSFCDGAPYLSVNNAYWHDGADANCPVTFVMDCKREGAE